MACNDPIFGDFPAIEAGATYTLEVEVPDGATAFAEFAEAGAAAFVRWPKAKISPGPKTQALSGTKVLHAVYITVVIDAAHDVAVIVKASVGGTKYCRTIKGKAKKERIVHYLEMN